MCAWEAWHNFGAFEVEQVVGSREEVAQDVQARLGHMQRQLDDAFHTIRRQQSRIRALEDKERDFAAALHSQQAAKPPSSCLAPDPPLPHDSPPHAPTRHPSFKTGAEAGDAMVLEACPRPLSTFAWPDRRERTGPMAASQVPEVVGEGICESSPEVMLAMVPGLRSHGYLSASLASARISDGVFST